MDIAISGKDIAIDWNWVRSELIKKEKIGTFDKNASAKTLHACVDACIKKAEGLTHPEVCSMKRRVISIQRNTIKLEKGIVFTGKRLAQ